MNEKKISVIIPGHNVGSILQECLKRLFKSRYSNFEVIFVDDCSCDESLGIARRYPCRVVILAEQRGPAFARDRGVSLAEGEIVAFLDSDCLVPEDWLAKINLKLSEALSGIGGKYLLPKDTGGLPALFMTYWDPKNVFYSKAVTLISLSGGNCAFWKKDLLRARSKKELVFCNKRVGGDDTIFCAEMAERGRLLYDPDITLTHYKKRSLAYVLRETVGLGYSGAIVSQVCGAALLKEPHRMYKTVLYICSLLVVCATVSLLFTKAWVAYGLILIAYLVLQFPFIALTIKELPRPAYAVFFPLVICMCDFLSFVGHLKRAGEVMRYAALFFVWHLKLLLATLNPAALLRVFFFVTKQCNATCYFCFSAAHRARNEDKDLSLEEIKTIAKRIGFLPWLTLTGGEPFLREDIYDICKLFYVFCDTRIISIATNGTLVCRIKDTVERLLIDCPQIYLTLIVALDDIAAAHDALKGSTGVHAQARLTLEKLRLLQARFPKLSVGINTTILKENVGRLEEIFEYFAACIPFDRQCINLLRKDPCSSETFEFIPVSEYLALMKKWTLKKNRHKGFKGLTQRFGQAALEYFCERSLKECKRRKALSTCFAARKFFVIDHEGSVSACELLPESLGNVREMGYDFGQLRSSSRVKQARAQIKASRCYCQWACAVATNGYFNPFVYPRIFWRMLSLVDTCG